MLRSKYCTLSAHADKQSLADAGECPYDQGGYFIVNGKEKVLVAQERLRCNAVFVFERQGGAFAAEVRSQLPRAGARSAIFAVRFDAPKKGGPLSSPVLRAAVPGVAAEVPVAVLFRALGDVPDRVLLQRVCHDFRDTELLELLKGSLEEAEGVASQEAALDYIGRRGRGSFINSIIIFYLFSNFFTF